MMEMDNTKPKDTENLSRTDNIKEGGYYVSRWDHEELQRKHDDTRTAYHMLLILSLIVFVYGVLMTSCYVSLANSVKADGKELHFAKDSLTNFKNK